MLKTGQTIHGDQARAYLARHDAELLDHLEKAQVHIEKVFGKPYLQVSIDHDNDPHYTAMYLVSGDTAKDDDWERLVGIHRTLTEENLVEVLVALTREKP